MSNLLAADMHSPEAQQLLYAPLSGANEMVTAAAVSSSGQFMCVGTSAGTVGQYVKRSEASLAAFQQQQRQEGQEGGMRSTELYKVNQVRE